MNFAPRSPAILLIISLFLFSACVGTNPSNKNAAGSNTTTTTNTEPSAARDDIEELESIVNLPFHPDEALWRDDTGEKPRKLIAVLKFATADSPKVFEAVAKGGNGTPYEIETESWFPPELVAKSQESGDETIKGKSYPATDLVKPPFNEGKISRIDGTDFYIVELVAK